MKTFKDLGLSKELRLSLEELGFENPTLIQEKTIPLVIKGKDVLGESATGSGKTLAFGSTIVENVVPNQGLQALVLTPTRELAEQVKEALKRFSSRKHFRVTAVYGGVSINPQIHALSKSEVVVGTPGRLLDHLERQTIDLSKLKILVLDEADRMLDMGFMPDVQRIIKQCPRDRQTLLFSATISQEVNKIAKKYLKNHTLVRATKMVDPSKLKQYYYDIAKNKKLSLLINLLNDSDYERVMVFCNTRNETDFVFNNLKANGFNAISIHGGLSQDKRTKTMSFFNRSERAVLVCTDVAARGLDIAFVSHVINYDLPKEAKDYIHRIGRTARAGKEGVVINLISDNDYDSFSRIQRFYSDLNIERLDTPELKKVKIVTSLNQNKRGNSSFGRVNNREHFGRRDYNSRSHSRRGNYGENRGFGSNYKRKKYVWEKDSEDDERKGNRHYSNSNGDRYHYSDGIRKGNNKDNYHSHGSGGNFGKRSNRSNSDSSHRSSNEHSKRRSSSGKRFY